MDRKGDAVDPVKLDRLIRPLQNLKKALLRLEGYVAPYPEAAAAVQDALRALDEFSQAPRQEKAFRQNLDDLVAGSRGSKQSGTGGASFREQLEGLARRGRRRG